MGMINVIMQNHVKINAYFILCLSQIPFGMGVTAQSRRKEVERNQGATKLKVWQ